MSQIKIYISLIIRIKNKIIYHIKKYGIFRTIKKCIKLFPKKLVSLLIFLKNNSRYGYLSWRKKNEPTKRELKEQKKHIFKINPKVSIVVPMYKTNKKFLKQMIKSVQKQTYSNWELCIADGSPKESKLVKKISKKDNRIKYKFLKENMGISKNSNEAIKMANGDYIALLDHDDTLAPFALYEIVKCINNNLDIDFIYSDEDILSFLRGKRIRPIFKPDFSIDYLRDCNYICHLSVIKKELMDRLKGFNWEYEGSQDHDLVLRIAENTNKIYHIPKVLYHWRNVATSFSHNTETRIKAWDSGKKAVQDHLNRLQIPAVVEKGSFLGHYKIEYKLQGNPSVDILIPNKDEVKTLKRCINSILNLTTYKNYNIIVIENNSESKEILEYYEDLKKYNNIQILQYQEKGFNYSKLINFGVANSNSEYILQLNNDTEVIEPTWLENMLQYIQRKDVGIVGAKLLYYDKTVQHAGVVIGQGSIPGHIYVGHPSETLETSAVKNMSAVTGACLMSKRKIYKEVNFMNEELEVALNDVDFCLKVREKGYLVIYTPYAKLYHYESKSRGLEDTEEKAERFNKECELVKKTWKKLFDNGDPYYNINLSLRDGNAKIFTGKINYN